MKLDKKDVNGKDWAFIPDTNNLYAISKEGKIYSFKSNTIFKNGVNKREGYEFCGYKDKDNKNIRQRIRTIMIRSFYPELKNDKIMILNKNGNKRDNRLENLQIYNFGEKYNASEAAKIRLQYMSEEKRNNVLSNAERNKEKIKESLKNMWRNVDDTTRPVIDGINWRYVEDTNNGYAISRSGDLYSVKNDRFMSKRTDKDGYVVYNMTVNGKQKTKKAHRLVAFAFIPNDDPLKMIINHKNEIKDDNRVENLEWCTNKYNISYGDANEKRTKSLKIAIKNYWDNISDEERAERFINESKTKLEETLKTLPAYRRDDPIILTRFLCYYVYKLNYGYNYKTPYNLTNGIQYDSDITGIEQKDFFFPKYTDIA